MDNEYIPAIISASIALIAAVGAQFLAHYLERKRICKENDNRSYRKFVFPFISEILIFYETETDFRKGHDVEKNINTECLVERISNKIQYSNMKLLASYNELVKSRYFIDNKGDLREIQTLRFFYTYLVYSLEIMNKQGLKKEELFNQINIMRVKYGLWILVAQEIGYESSMELMGLDFYIQKEFYTESLQNKLDELVGGMERALCQNEGDRVLESFLAMIKDADSNGGEFPSVVELEHRLQENKCH